MQRLPLGAFAVLLVLLGAAPAARAAEDCFLVTELKSGQVAAKQGLCATRHSPASTFKIALSLMGFDAGILKSDSEPVWTRREGLADGLETWRGPQTPRSWMKYSVVWYSQILTQTLGAERLDAYVRGFAYGNGDLSGDPGQDNGLTRAWLSSSLRISPREQVDFLRRMLNGELPVAPGAVAQTLSLLAEGVNEAGFEVYGKTGTGSLPSARGDKDSSRPFGWYVGWAEKDGRTFVFARFISFDIPASEPLGPLARRQAQAALVPILKAQSR